ncbi:hypothetical protein BH10CHL1_BH10CHL1_33670 [soil metagenome]
MLNILMIGAGVVGQATGKGLAKKGYTIGYIDIDREKLAQLSEQGLLVMQPDQINWPIWDIIMVAVPTPTINGRISLAPLISAMTTVASGLVTTSKFVVVVVRSTVPPTTTEQQLRPILEKFSGKQAGSDFGLAVNPEFLRQRSSEQDFARPWITVLGATDRLTNEILYDIYAPFGGLIIQCAPTEAEMIKYVNNIYNALKISYFNEVHEICEKLAIDSNLVSAVVARSAEGMWNPLYGTRGGEPYAGACLPKDTEGFLAFCQDQGWETLMLAATIQVNHKLQTQLEVATTPKLTASMPAT